MITELIRSEPEVCVCDGSKLEFKGEAVSVRTEKIHDGQRCDRILRLFLRPENGQFSPHFEAISLHRFPDLTPFRCQEG